MLITLFLKKYYKLIISTFKSRNPWQVKVKNIFLVKTKTLMTLLIANIRINNSIQSSINVIIHAIVTRRKNLSILKNNSIARNEDYKNQLK